MPLINISALPFDPPRDSGDLAQAIAREFAHQCNIGLEHVSVVWNVIPANSYAVNGQTRASQGSDFPLLVELMAPDFHPKEQLQLMLKRLAWVISRECEIDETQLLITYRPVLSGLVYDQGKILDWNS